MKIAYFDCFSGISGDMALGALIHAGAPLEVITNGLALLDGLPDTLRYSTKDVVRSAIHAVKFDVLGQDGSPIDRGLGEKGMGELSSKGANAHHEHDHHSHDGEAHSHDGGEDSEGSHKHHHGHTHDNEDHGHHGDGGHDHHHTTWASIRRMIEESKLTSGAKERATAIFHAIAVGEARVHNMNVEDVHFHEVGAFDSIVDIVGTAIALDYFGVDALYSSSIPLGSGGMIRTQHGIMPLPAPATMEILKGYPVQLTNVPFELTTPTGAGIIRGLSKGTLDSALFSVDCTGFGAGTRELPDRPNLLRVVIGTLDHAEEQDTVTLIEANIDDLNPQIWPFVMERLLESGALDVWLTPTLMKKGRPGHVISVLAANDLVDRLLPIMWQETTTIGVRTSTVARKKLQREEVVVQTEFGPVKMKRVEEPQGTVLRPEADEARRIAAEHSMSMREVIEQLTTRN